MSGIIPQLPYTSLWHEQGQRLRRKKKARHSNCASSNDRGRCFPVGTSVLKDLAETASIHYITRRHPHGTLRTPSLPIHPPLKSYTLISIKGLILALSKHAYLSHPFPDSRGSTQSA